MRELDAKGSGGPRRAVRTRHAPRWWIAYREHVWWPAWVGRGARAWQGGVLSVFWPVLLWAFGTGLFSAAGHTPRLLIIATMLGWLGIACCAAAAVLPFAGGVLVVVSPLRAAPTSADRARALRLRDLDEAEV